MPAPMRFHGHAAGTRTRLRHTGHPQSLGFGLATRHELGMATIQEAGGLPWGSALASESRISPIIALANSSIYRLSG